ncbi:hypothetical protein ERJ75_000359600 [Trypanosoma vivax]|nr:hypothetical protein TRVL_01649 [Trypanosoma vivax]KAH8617620.1 hypothetical protein ERJ75_000359600 [Trypanosoma vivax]
MYYEGEGNDEAYDGLGRENIPSDQSTPSVSDMPLPPLPPPTPPSDVYGLATDEIYSIIKELRRQIDDPAKHQDIKAMLKKEPSVLLAVARVLHESGLLWRTAVNGQGQIEEQLVPMPDAPTPPLPSGYNSWVCQD